MMKIVKLIVGPMASNCYIAWDEDTKDAVIIDPGFEDDRIMETVEKPVSYTHLDVYKRQDQCGRSFR